MKNFAGFAGGGELKMIEWTATFAIIVLSLMVIHYKHKNNVLKNRHRELHSALGEIHSLAMQLNAQNHIYFMEKIKDKADLSEDILSAETLEEKIIAD